MKNRFNVSLSDDCIRELDRISKDRSTTRSGAIEYLARKSRKEKDDKHIDDDLVKVRDYASKISSDISSIEDFDERNERKIDAFYRICGFIESTCMR